MIGSLEPAPGLELFGTPEEAALSGWRTTPSALARVTAVEPSEEFDGVWVTVAVDGHPDFPLDDVTSCWQASSGQWFAA